jgi:hypothetical protein
VFVVILVDGATHLEMFQMGNCDIVEIWDNAQNKSSFMYFQCILQDIELPPRPVKQKTLTSQHTCTAPPNLKA